MFRKCPDGSSWPNPALQVTELLGCSRIGANDKERPLAVVQPSRRWTSVVEDGATVNGLSLCSKSERLTECTILPKMARSFYFRNHRLSSAFGPTAAIANVYELGPLIAPYSGRNVATQRTPAPGPIGAICLNVKKACGDGSQSIMCMIGGK